MDAVLDTSPLTGAYWKDNYLWGIGMQLCWNQLSEDIVGGAVQLKTQKPEAQELISCFNQKHFDQAAISPDCLYTKAGLGPEILDVIKRELGARFPNRSTDTLNHLSPSQVDLICFSYLFKKFQHESTFNEISMSFLGTSVKGFSPESPTSKGLEILDYDNDDNFVLKLASNNRQDEIILVKGNKDASMRDILNFLKGRLRGLPLDKQAIVQIPNVKVDVVRKYSALLGSELRLSDRISESYILTEMQEQIKLSLNYQGARVENEAVMSFTRGGSTWPRKLIFDQPFWLIMKEAQSPQPYLILKVNNVAPLEQA